LEFEGRSGSPVVLVMDDPSYEWMSTTPRLLTSDHTVPRGLRENRGQHQPCVPWAAVLSCARETWLLPETESLPLPQDPHLGNIQASVTHVRGNFRNLTTLASRVWWKGSKIIHYQASAWYWHLPAQRSWYSGR